VKYELPEAVHAVEDKSLKTLTADDPAVRIQIDLFCVDVVVQHENHLAVPISAFVPAAYCGKVKVRVG